MRDLTRCTHSAVANFPVGGAAEGWRDRWLCNVCRTEFVPLVQVQASIDTMRAYRDAACLQLQEAEAKIKSLERDVIHWERGFREGDL
jgi:hypothetical protein